MQIAHPSGMIPEGDYGVTRGRTQKIITYSESTHKNAPGKLRIFKFGGRQLRQKIEGVQVMSRNQV